MVNHMLRHTNLSCMVSVPITCIVFITSVSKAHCQLVVNLFIYKCVKLDFGPREEVVRMRLSKK